MPGADIEKAMLEMQARLRDRLMGTLKDDELRSLQLHMDVLDQWARLGNADAAAGHDHDHMDDHDHAMKVDVISVSLPGDLAGAIVAGSAVRTKA